MGTQQTLNFGRTPLLIAGVVGVLAGAVYAKQTHPTPALAAPTAFTPGDGAIRFLDSSAPQSPLVPAPTSPVSPLTTPDATAATPTNSNGTRVVIILTLLVGGALGLMLMKSKRPGAKGGKAPVLEVLGQVRVAGRWQVALVKVPGKTLVLGANEKGLNLLSTIDAEDAIEAGLDDDELVAAVTADDRIDVGRSRPRPDAALGRSETPRPGPDARLQSPADPRTAYARTDTRSSPSEPFGRLLDELTRGAPATGPSAARDRVKTDEAQALRARLERYQNPTTN